MQHISKITDQFVEKLPVNGSRYEVKEKSGLSIEVLKSGKKVWRKRLWLNGKSKTVTLGNFPEMLTKSARERFFEDEPEEVNIYTVESLANQFLERYVRNNRKGIDRIEQVFKADIIPSLGHIKLHQITVNG